MSTSNVRLEFEAHSNVTEIPPEEIAARTRAARQALGDEVLVLGHHYQRDPVIRFADKTGDSYGLARHAASARGVRWVVFCGVHFMAETADILTGDDVDVLLPDLKAGCTMADMADIDQVESCWEEYASVCEAKLVPVTYMNSTAAIKAFTGAHGGVVCTSSNAERCMRWSFEQGEKVLFLPDQHLGRYTGHFRLDIPLDEMIVWNPHKPLGGQTPEAVRRARVLLWAGHCGVHMNFKPEHVDAARKRNPQVRVIVHPECELGVVEKADLVGSTDFILKTIAAAPPGSAWAVGTEHNLVQRLAALHPEQRIQTLSPFACQCATMYRIDPVDLMRTLEGLRGGELRWPVRVPEAIAADARIALERMLVLAPT
jgi:quinolinate synthase